MRYLSEVGNRRTGVLLRRVHCTDLALLDRWFDRALRADTLSGVLAEPRSHSRAPRA